MLLDVTIHAPAKVNLGLKVFPKRADGFHNIESIFQTVGLKDTLNVQVIPEDNKCIVDAGSLILPESNTFTTTYNAFCRLTGIHTGVKVTLKKVIPLGGGLGGGSSDGAYFLKALAMIHDVELTDELADAVAAEVGSDVFFFLHSGENEINSGCAVVTGRGEFVKQIHPREDLYFILIFPQIHSSTKEAYGLVDSSYEAGVFTSCPELTDLEAIYRSPLKGWTFANSFTSVLVQKYPVIGKAIEDLRNSGCPWADMSGSGATVFGVFDSKSDAEKSFVQLQKSWNHCILLR